MPATTTDSDAVADQLSYLSTTDDSDDTNHTIANLVAAYGNPPKSELEFDDFVNTRMGERSVMDVPGIGAVAAKKLERNGITKAWQLLGPVLYMTTEEVLDFFTNPETCGVAPSKARHIVLSLVMNFQRHNADDRPKSINQVNNNSNNSNNTNEHLKENPCSCDTMKELVDAFRTPNDYYCEATFGFVDHRMGERGVKNVHGIGAVSEENLKKNGITKAWQLLGPLLYMNTEEVLDFIKDPEKCGVAPAMAKKTVLCLAMNFQKHNQY